MYIPDIFQAHMSRFWKWAFPDRFARVARGEIYRDFAMIWAIVILMTLAVAWVILRAFLKVPDGANASELDVQVYKDQLQSLNSDVERGLVTGNEAEAARLEISRRLLAADKRAQNEVAAGTAPASKLFLVVVALFLLAGSLGLYQFMGNPELPDQPLAARLEAVRIARENRPHQIEAETQIGTADKSQISTADLPEDYLKLVKQLRETMKQHPNDIVGWELLAANEARIGNMHGAWQAKEKVILLLADKAEGKDYAELAEYMIIATKGYVSVEAEDALARALKLDVKSPRARYYSGLALAQNGQPDVAYRMWAALLEEGPADAPWMPLIRGQIGAMAQAAGINMADQNAPGPSADQVEAAGQMSEAERQDMIRGMIAGLAERLDTKGGAPNEWVRLIRAYGVLGETDKALGSWNKARDVFAKDAAALALLLEAAQAAGVAD